MEYPNYGTPRTQPRGRTRRGSAVLVLIVAVLAYAAATFLPNPFLGHNTPKEQTEQVATAPATTPQQSPSASPSTQPAGPVIAVPAQTHDASVFSVVSHLTATDGTPYQRTIYDCTVGYQLIGLHISGAVVSYQDMQFSIKRNFPPGQTNFAHERSITVSFGGNIVHTEQSITTMVVGMYSDSESDPSYNDQVVTLTPEMVDKGVFLDSDIFNRGKANYMLYLWLCAKP